MTVNQETRRLALITGASAGIGAAFVRVFAESGFDVALTARRADRLEALAEEVRKTYRVDAQAIAADLADPAAPARIIAEIEGRGRHVSALVNNAGYGVPYWFRTHPWPVHADFLQVMVTAPVHLTYLVVGGMVEHGYGRIINVASLAGFAPGSAGQTLYGPAKALLIKFSESMTLEHAAENIHTTLLAPGLTHTEFHDLAKNKDLLRRVPAAFWMDADECARRGFAAVMAGKPTCIPGFLNRALVSLLRHTPRSTALRMMARHSKDLRLAGVRPQRAPVAGDGAGTRPGLRAVSALDDRPEN
jgi:short-subunit dehydrogenase